MRIKHGSILPWILVTILKSNFMESYAWHNHSDIWYDLEESWGWTNHYGTIKDYISGQVEYGVTNDCIRSERKLSLK